MSTKVLVVEDDLEINELLGEYLTLEGIDYIQATSGKQGIHRALAEHPDVIVLDLMLPDIDGFEVARTLSSKRVSYDIPIIILSCMCQDCDKQKGFSSGALYFINKPFLPDELLERLREALAWRAGRKERTPGGRMALGGAEAGTSVKAVNEMIADLFAGTDLNDATMGQIREALETLGQWARQWNEEHPSSSELLVDYRVGGQGTGSNEPGGIEWTLSESSPGMLADAFFKPAANAGGGLLGWGAGSLLTKPMAAVAPPARWLQVLAKTGAATFEKDSKAHTVRFTRSATNPEPARGPSVPVVEIDGARYPTRLRKEALAARRA